MSNSTAHIFEITKQDDKSYFLAILISDGIEHVSKIPAPNEKFAIMDIEESYAKGCSWRETYSFISLDEDQDFWVSNILAVTYNRNQDTLTVYFKNPARFGSKEINIFKFTYTDENIRVECFCKEGYSFSHDCMYTGSYSLEPIFFAFRSLGYINGYCIIALNGSSYQVDFIYNYFDYNEITKLQCIHEPCIEGGD